MNELMLLSLLNCRQNWTFSSIKLNQILSLNCVKRIEFSSRTKEQQVFNIWQQRPAINDSLRAKKVAPRAISVAQRESTNGKQRHWQWCQ